MKPFSKILVPVDFSKHSDAAIDTAIDLARRYDASITLFNVFEPLSYVLPDDSTVYPGPATADLMGDILKALEKKKASAVAKGATQISVAQDCGSPAFAISDFAQAQGHDLIVVGTLGRTGIARALLGSVAERVVRTAHCPVLTVHEGAKPFSKILVPTDFSTGAALAIDAAIELAQRYDAKLTLVNIVEPMGYALPGDIGGYASLPIDDMIADQRAALEKLASEVRAKGAKHVEIVQRTGYAPMEIHDLAQSRGFDLIAMGTHGRSGFSHLFMGSVAERVVRIAPCPVLTIREEPTS